MSFTRVEQALDDAVARGVFPGAVLLVRDGTRTFYQRAVGYRQLEPTRAAMEEGTIFDVASLTKPLATTIAVMLLVRDGKLHLDDRVTRFLHNFGVHGKTHVTLRHLLNHSSGLPAWKPYFKDILAIEKRGEKINFLGSAAAKEYVFNQISREKPEAPAGTAAVYSDLGFMLLGALVEMASGATLDRFCQDRIIRPLGLRATSFIDLGMVRARRIQPVTELIAATERCPWRKRVLCGEVHDDNAYAMGGVAGHAGLFASARDVDTIASRLLACWNGADDFVPPAIVREFWTRSGPAGSTWALGWDTPSPQQSSAGTRFSPHTVGHLGFTGTSLWIDLERQRHVILLSNRVHPTRDNALIKDFRPLIHDLVNEALP
ncbi:MAG: serine hydrolase domain-containing protein [Deltaproteobacteria bacterium]|nr:serine hydrolase domain-containing protein [Deltaproteobacteria bacterium]